MIRYVYVYFVGNGRSFIIDTAKIGTILCTSNLCDKKYVNCKALFNVIICCIGLDEVKSSLSELSNRQQGNSSKCNLIMFLQNRAVFVNF
jgi:hypothetical protein